MPLYRIITFFALTGFSFGIKSQVVTDDIYTPFESYTTKDGLSHNQINDLYQDCYGYLWVATENGLNRFDGYSFVVFRNNPDDSTSISGDVVTSLAGDDRGNLWVGTTEGLNFYHRRSNRFIRYSSDIYNPNSIRSNHIRKVLLIREQLWIETLEGTLSCLNLKKSCFDHYTHQPVSQPYYRYHALYMDRKGILWIGGRNLGVTKFSPENRQFTAYEANPNDSRKKRDNDLAAIIHTLGGKYYAGGIDGFYAFQPATGDFEKLYSSSTFSLAELADGQILMGTGFGMVIYDPQRKHFTRYMSNVDNPQSIIGNHVNKVLADRNKNIWVGTEDGLSLLRSNAAAVKQFFHIPGYQTTLSGNNVTSILKDGKGRVWVSTKSHGLNLWDTTQNTFKHYRHDPQNPNSLASENIRKIYEDRGGKLWIALWSGVGFNRFDPERNRFTRYALDFNSRKRDWYNDIIEDSRGNLWMGIWGSSGFQQFDRRKGEFVNENYRSGHVPINQNIKSIIDDGCGNLFLHTTSSIIYRYQSESGLFAAHVGVARCCEKDSANYRFFACDLPVNIDSVYAIASNRKGITLLSTNRGVLAFNAGSKNFMALNSNDKTISMDFDDRNDCFWLFSENNVFRVDSISEGVQWVGSLKTDIDFKHAILKCDKQGGIWCIQGNLIHLFNFGNMQFEPISSAAKFASTMPSGIVEYEDGLVLSTRTGLFHASSKTREVKPIQSQPRDSIIVSNTTGIAMLDRVKLLLASNYGFYLFDLRGNTLQRVQVDNIPANFTYSIGALATVGDKVYITSNNRNIYEMSLSYKSIRQINIPDRYMVSSRLTTCLLEDEDGCIWIGSSDNGLSRLNPKTRLFDHFLKGNAPRSLPSEDVTCLYRCSRNRIWIGTNNGLCRYRREDTSIVRMRQNALSGRIESIIESPDSALWIATQTGLVRFDPTSGECTLLDESDGLTATTYNRGVCLLSPSRLAFATNSGVVTINPLTFRKMDKLDPVSIAEIKVFDRVQSYTVRHNDTITLRYNENSVSISFSSLTFGRSDATHFSYTITGMEGHWVTSTTNFANFANLSPGRYTFRVTPKGLESKIDAHTLLNIVITPPFWKTIWFWTLIVSALLSIGALILVGYIKQIKISERNVVLEQKLLASQMNPHFIFNSLSAIQSFMYHNEAEEAGNYLANFSRLVRLILENSRSEWISIEKEVQTLNLYLNLQLLRFANRFDYQVEVDPRINRKIVCIPPMLAQPFIENSIEHGIMPKKGKGNILITFKLVDGLILIEVVDDGIGLKRSESINRNREHHTSFAMQITRERLASLKRHVNDRVGIAVYDRSEMEPVSGVKVTLHVPYKMVAAHNMR